jgi:hypothetical protein
MKVFVTPHSQAVMPGLVPGIHVFRSVEKKTWMAGSSPAMTKKILRGHQ